MASVFAITKETKGSELEEFVKSNYGKLKHTIGNDTSGIVGGLIELGDRQAFQWWEWQHHPYYITWDGLEYEILSEVPNCHPIRPAKHTPLSTQVGGSHYKDMAIQPVEFIHRNGIGFIPGNVIKYVCRYKDKNGIEDLKKARHYLDMLIEMEEKK